MIQQPLNPRATNNRGAGSKIVNDSRSLLRVVTQPGDQVVPVLGLLQTTEGHLGARNVFLGVLEVFEQRVLVPRDALLLVGICVGVALDGTSLAAEETVQVRADLVAFRLDDSVALSASRLEEVGTLLRVTCKGRL